MPTNTGACAHQTTATERVLKAFAAMTTAHATHVQTVQFAWILSKDSNACAHHGNQLALTVLILSVKP